VKGSCGGKGRIERGRKGVAQKNGAGREHSLARMCRGKKKVDEGWIAKENLTVWERWAHSKTSLTQREKSGGEEKIHPGKGFVKHVSGKKSEEKRGDLAGTCPPHKRENYGLASQGKKAAQGARDEKNNQRKISYLNQWEITRGMNARLRSGGPS